ncbi:hypothetical protein ACILG0_04455 [Pseudomonadota bacterium AL_CKDN230030165-1A_HGKHYDSX7]
MKTIIGQDFRMSQDRGNAIFEDIRFKSCSFDNCALSLVKNPARMSRVHNVEISGCRATHCEIGPTVFEDVRIEDLATNPILLVWACTFRHVRLAGKIGTLNINAPPHAFCTDERMLAGFEMARDLFYRETDWALDISEARFLALRCEGVPLHLVRRDPSTQVVLHKSRFPGMHAFDAGFAAAFPIAWSVIGSFAESDNQAMLMVVPLAAPKSRRDDYAGAIAELRRMGCLDDGV